MFEEWGEKLSQRDDLLFFLFVGERKVVPPSYLNNADYGAGDGNRTQRRFTLTY